MFEGIKYRRAVSRVLQQLRRRDFISTETAKQMKGTVFHRSHADYARAILRTGTAQDDHAASAAAAAVFARIAASAETEPAGPIPALLWRAAARQALINTGLSDTESHLAAADLIIQQQEIDTEATPKTLVAGLTERGTPHG